MHTHQKTLCIGKSRLLMHLSLDSKIAICICELTSLTKLNFIFLSKEKNKQNFENWLSFQLWKCICDWSCCDSFRAVTATNQTKLHRLRTLISFHRFTRMTSFNKDFACIERLVLFCFVFVFLFLRFASRAGCLKE